MDVHKFTSMHQWLMSMMNRKHSNHNTKTMQSGRVTSWKENTNQKQEQFD